MDGYELLVYAGVTFLVSYTSFIAAILTIMWWENRGESFDGH